MLGLTPPTNADLYLAPYPEDEPKVLPTPEISWLLEKPPQPNNMDDLPSPHKTKLLYHVNKVTSIHRLCIPPSVAPDILTMGYGKGHPGFSHCYKIITRSWFI